ncbi:hypothetical protein E4T52_15972 [Aureobasidium sp. EXF-3400]|nr:hypothetical protein E4T51_15180 [Aureobasidium sp. EXF-12344]KAI4768966.1 hypothetical protein E4T52_15972 [Aureobasidium sp. EXF-3400]
MHLLQSLLSLFSWFLVAQALAFDKRACVTSDVALIQQQVTHPDYFCTWYLSKGRTRSPLPNIAPDALLSACKCLINASPPGTWTRVKDDIYKAARLYSFTPAGCPDSAKKLIKNEFQNSAAFCTFWQAS